MTAAVPEAGVINYGGSSLSDVLPSTLAALGIDSEPNALGLASADCIVVLLIDGFGWNLLRRNAECAPFLSQLTGQPLTVGFPTTTVSSIASLGTGLPSGQHGLTGYTSRLNGLWEPINWLRWRGVFSGTNLIEQVAPEELQPIATALERAQLSGITVSVVASRTFRASGFTRAVLRGGSFLPVATAADTATVVAEAAAGPKPALIYCYNSELDLIGHTVGSGSEAWRVQLALIDRAVELMARRLPSGTRLLITGDHGMVDVPEDAKIDFDAERELSEGVEMLAGEARARYVHVEPGQVERVRERWSDRLGDLVALVSRADAIARGWFGPTVTPAAYDRIGDLIAVSTTDAAVVRYSAERGISSLVGQHGALTEDELLVPLLQYP
jgi:predicted AlkP superfamily pyrophosphatase or phosphodiesterase